MTCFIAKNLLSDYLDEVLDPARVPELQAHLAGCPSCSHELAELRRIRQALRALPLERAPAGFAARVIARAEQPTALERASRFLSAAWKIPAPAKAGLAFAASLVLVTTVWLNNPDRHRSAWELGGAPRSQSMSGSRVAVLETTPAGNAVAMATVATAARPSAPDASLGTGRAGGDGWETGRKGKDRGLEEAQANKKGANEQAVTKAPRQDVDAPLAGGYLADKSRGPELESANHLRRADTAGAEQAATGQSSAGEALPARLSPAPEKDAKKADARPVARVAALAKEKNEREESYLPALDGAPAESSPATAPGAPVAAGAGAGAAGGKRDGLVSALPPAATPRATAVTVAAAKPRTDGHAASSASRGEPVAAPPPSDAGAFGGGDVATAADSSKPGKEQPASKASDARTSTVTTEAADDLQAPAPTPKPKSGSKDNPIQVRFISDSATGPQEVVDAATAAGGTNSSGKPASLANVGASTRVLVNLPAGAWDAFAEKIGASGTLDLQGNDAPTGKVWVRIEVVKR